ncbi:MAG: chemotaxis protein CheX [Deltaproteobacteria bacterium]|nr:MAG: chemotaxis protein CheX [Deltaproteobacteria bacterium]
MGVQFFGEFLIDRWVITRGQLIEALELQNYRNPKFGQVGVERGYLTEEQVEQVHLQQRSTDKQFAELAISLGYLDQQQAEEILTYQKNNHLYLGEALLELGHITEEILERELAIFKEEQAQYEIESIDLPADVPSRPVLEVAVDLTRKLLERLAGLRVKVGDVQEGPVDASRDRHLTVSVAFDGTLKARYLLSPTSDVAVTIASAVLREDATRESEEVVEDAVKEFCNIVCGNAVAKLAQQGHVIDILPPETVAEIPPPADGEKCLVLPLHLAEGKLELRFLLPVAA